MSDRTNTERRALSETEGVQSLLGVLSDEESGGGADEQAHGGDEHDENELDLAGGEDLDDEGDFEVEEDLDPEHEADEADDESDDEDFLDGPLDFNELADELGITPEQLRLRVKVEGREEEITLQDAINDYSGQAASTRRFQEAAEARKAAEEKLQEARGLEDAVVARYGERLEALEQALAFQLPAEPKGNDPKAWAEYQRKTAEHQKVQKAIEDHRAAMAERQKHQIATKVAEEQRRLVEAIPEWANDEVRARETAQLVEYAKSVGITEQDLANIVDHRPILLLRKAQQFDALQQGKGKKVREKAKQARVIKPGSPKRGAQKKGSRKAAVERARKRLKDTRGTDQLRAGADVLIKSGMLD